MSQSIPLGSSEQPSTVVCPCGRPDEAETNMMQCERCLRYYHFGCANISESIADDDRHFICVRCIDRAPTVASSRSGKSTTSSCRAARAALELRRLEEERQMERIYIAKKYDILQNQLDEPAEEGSVRSRCSRRSTQRTQECEGEEPSSHDNEHQHRVATNSHWYPVSHWYNPEATSSSTSSNNTTNITSAKIPHRQAEITGSPNTCGANRYYVIKHTSKKRRNFHCNDESRSGSSTFGYASLGDNDCCTVDRQSSRRFPYYFARTSQSSGCCRFQHFTNADARRADQAIVRSSVENGRNSAAIGGETICSPESTVVTSGEAL